MFSGVTERNNVLNMYSHFQVLALLDLWLGLYNRIHFFAFREAETLIGLTYKFCLSPNTQENPSLTNYSLLSAYGIQLNPTCRESIILSLENDGGFLYPLIDK